MPSIGLALLSGRYLSFAEREEIAVLRAQGWGVRQIARRLGRSPSTISGELRRNAATRGGLLAYRAQAAPWHADRQARRPKVAELAGNDGLRADVPDRLAGLITAPHGTTAPAPKVRWIGRRHGRRTDRRWPGRGAGADRGPAGVDFPEDETMRISHEAIDQALDVQGRGGLRRELSAWLGTGRALRVPRARTRGPGKQFLTRRSCSASGRPRSPTGLFPGTGQVTFILGLGSSAIGTLVERRTRLAMLLGLPRMDGHGDQARVHNGPALAGHGAQAVRDAIATSIVTLPEQLRRSLTWDQGAEMAQHTQLRIDTGVQVFFCDPHSPGSAAPTRTPTGCCARTSPRAPT
jgi:IS30 family transposase